MKPQGKWIKNSVEKTGLPTYLRHKLLPIFQDLGSRDLLSKCTHGTTQNNNESLN